MSRRLRLVLLGLLVLGCLLTWFFAPSIARLVVFTSSDDQQHERAELADVDALSARVQASLPSLGLRKDQLQERTETEQQDSRGSWVTTHERWRLSTEDDPNALAQRLEALVASSEDQAEIYVVEQDDHRVQIRFYAGSRLALVLELEPSLGPWPTLARDLEPLLALVVHDVDSDPHGVRTLMARSEPLALALSPYSPFTLRLSRDALLTHTEILAVAEADVSLPESLEAVPHASGVLVFGSPSGDPDTQAQALRRADIYVLDAVEGGLGAHWLRALQDAGVPYLRASTCSGDLDRRRYRHSAAHSGAAVVLVAASAGASEADQLQAAAARGFRLAFPAEVVEALLR